MYKMEESKHFIHAMIEEELAPGGRYEGKRVHTRFPPEPNGYLTIGNAYAFNIDFGTAEKYGGMCNLRMDDTNPAKEDEEFVEAIKEDINWMGFDWGDRFYYGSDYFPQTYEFAVQLIKKGLAYVCELTPEEFRKNRGDIGVPATSPYRDRPMEESLDLFERMKNGEFPEGKYTLRARIDLASGNFNLRDPILYRIRYIEHHRQGTSWCVFPMYDFAHPIQDALECITHSLCSLEFKDHRPLYDWVIDNCEIIVNGERQFPHQTEFGRRSITYSIVSKRYLRRLVEENFVEGWDDPRMPTVCGLRRRGYTPAALRDFFSRIGVGVTSNTVEYALLEHCLREELNKTAARAMVVLRPVKLVITNYPGGKTESFEVENNPEDETMGTREISFSRELWIESDDFMVEPPKKYNRLFEGNEVRLKSAYVVKCTGCKTDEKGEVIEVYAEYDPETYGGNTPDGRKVRGTIHWVDANTAANVEVRLYDNLFSVAEPGKAEEFTTELNPNSLEILSNCKAEAMLADIEAPAAFQFMRSGYFAVDSKISKPGAPVFNRAVALKDGYKAG